MSTGLEECKEIPEGYHPSENIILIYVVMSKDRECLIEPSGSYRVPWKLNHSEFYCYRFLIDLINRLVIYSCTETGFGSTTQTEQRR
jgi:hypothetical protein